MSGKQDEYAAVFGGLNYISFHPEGTTLVEPVELEPPVLREFQSNLMLFFTGAAHHSWTILQEQEASTLSRNETTVDALHEVKALGGRMRTSLERGELHQFGELLHEGWQAKRRISHKISTPRIDKLYSLGCFSAELSEGKSRVPAAGDSSCSIVRRRTKPPFGRPCTRRAFMRWRSALTRRERRRL
jgi:galactokinase/mevalonate kinase-like predicted kinase